MRNHTKLITYSSVLIVAGASYLWLKSESIEQYLPQVAQLFNGKSPAPLTDSAQLKALQAKTLTQANTAIAEAEAALAEATAEPNEESQEHNVDNRTWALNKDDDQPATSPYPKVSVFSPVRLNPHPEKMPTTGEQVQLPLPGGETITANVENTQTTETGEYIWSGHLANHDSDYPIVMTYGENSTFATITTPNGSYTMEAINGKGTIFKNPAEVELSHPGATDFLEPQIQ